MHHRVATWLIDVVPVQTQRAHGNPQTDCVGLIAHSSAFDSVRKLKLNGIVSVAISLCVELTLLL